MSKSQIFIGNIKNLVLTGNIKKPSFYRRYLKAQFILALLSKEPNIVNIREIPYY